MHDDITDVPGITVGHDTNQAAQTGCTVILCEPNAIGGVDVRGGAPGTRETDLLNPTCMVNEVHAVVLTGGSAFGLEAATGVMRALWRQDVGYNAGAARVPIVPAAVIFDLGVGASDVWPDAASGERAVAAATDGPIAQGRVGVGTGATYHKFEGPDFVRPGGVGSASVVTPDGMIVGALVVVNALGDVRRDAQSSNVAASEHALTSPFQSNTTLAVIATSAHLDKAQATKVAQMAHDGLARVINPLHTPFDGDVVFTLSLPDRSGEDLSVPINVWELAQLGAVAADLLARAVLKAVA